MLTNILLIPSVYYAMYLGESEAYPKEAVQAYHEKPQPTHQVGANTKPKIIQQPKK